MRETPIEVMDMGQLGNQNSFASDIDLVVLQYILYYQSCSFRQVIIDEDQFISLQDQSSGFLPTA